MKKLQEQDIIRMMREEWLAKVSVLSEEVDLSFKANVDGESKEVISKEVNSPIAILVLGDQSPPDSNKSYWMNFLHQQTAVLFGTEQMANEYEFSVVFFAMEKVKRGFYKMRLELITEDPKSMNWGEITESHTKLLEKEINLKPQFWIWSHKRWKRAIPENLEQLKKDQLDKFNSKYRTKI